MATDIFVDFSATYNGDGTVPDQAAGTGQQGAYNSLLFLSSDFNWTESTVGHVWIRRMIKTSFPDLYIYNGGYVNAFAKLIGWPISVEFTDYTVKSVPSGNDSLGYANNLWQFSDTSLTQDDNYWVGGSITFTSGNNSGQTRMIIWFDNSTNTVYLDFNLPYAISVNDTYTINLTTEYYADRPESAKSLWDSDSLPRPVIDYSNNKNSLHLQQSRWELCNLKFANTPNTGGITNCPEILKNSYFYNCAYVFRDPANISGIRKAYLNKVFGDNFGYAAALETTFDTILDNCHFQGNGAYGLSYYPPNATNVTLKNCSFGKVISFDADILLSDGILVKGDNVIFANNDSHKVKGFGKCLFLSSYNNDINKFIQVSATGKIYSEEKGSLNPPSGSDYIIKLETTFDDCNDIFPLIYEEQRYQEAGLTTYTWKIYPVGYSTLTTDDISVTAVYLDSINSTHTDTVSANISSVTNNSWNDLTITVNSERDGIVYFEIHFKKHENSCYIILDSEVDVQ